MHNKRTDRIFIISVLAFVTLLIIFGTIKSKIISKKGIYVVAVIEKISTSKSGSLVDVKYYYKQRELKSNFKPGYDFKLEIGRKFYIKILPEDPSKFNYYNIDVPECALDSNWRNGWKEIPNCDKE